MSREQKEALDWVNKKEQKRDNPRFHNFPEATFYQEVRDRINNPERISQQQTYTCGPAAMLYGLAKKQPQVYAKFVCNLYAFGEATIGHMRIVAPTDVLATQDNDDARQGMRSADWVAVASLRRSKNWVFTDLSTLRGGGTFAYTLRSWFEEAGFTAVNDTTLVTASTWENWTDACTRCNNGEIVCIWMHSNMLEKAPDLNKWIDYAGVASNRSIFPNHWVGLAEVKSIRNPVKVVFFSWGHLGTLEFSQAEEANFIRHYYGFVSARA